MNDASGEINRDEHHGRHECTIHVDHEGFLALQSGTETQHEYIICSANHLSHFRNTEQNGPDTRLAPLGLMHRFLAFSHKIALYCMVHTVLSAIRNFCACLVWCP